MGDYAAVAHEFTGDACKAARYLLGWTVQDLCRAASCAKMTVVRFETGEHVLPRTRESLRTAFEKSGVSFHEVDEAPDVIEVRLPDGTAVRGPPPES